MWQTIEKNWGLIDFFVNLRLRCHFSKSCCLGKMPKIVLLFLQYSGRRYDEFSNNAISEKNRKEFYDLKQQFSSKDYPLFIYFYSFSLLSFGKILSKLTFRQYKHIFTMISLLKWSQNPIIPPRCCAWSQQHIHNIHDQETVHNNL